MIECKYHIGFTYYKARKIFCLIVTKWRFDEKYSCELACIIFSRLTLCFNMSYNFPQSVRNLNAVRHTAPRAPPCFNCPPLCIWNKCADNCQGTAARGAKNCCEAASYAACCALGVSQRGISLYVYMPL